MIECKYEIQIINYVLNHLNFENSKNNSKSSKLYQAQTQIIQLYQISSTLNAVIR